jgi:tetratricopeptide (TPR) repeat protein
MTSLKHSSSFVPQQYFLMIIIFISLNLVYAQTPDTIDTVAFPEKTGVHEDISNQDVHKVERKQEDSINRNINILTVFAALMSVLVGLITLIVLSIAGFGFFEYKRWRNIRKKAEQNAKIIEDIRNKVQEDADRLQEEASKSAPPSLTYEPSENIKERFSEISRRLEFLELFNISLKPEDHNSRGVDLLFKKRYEDALKTFDKALELNPNYAEAWANKGIVFGKLNRHEDALKTFDKALELKPDAADVWVNKGIVFGMLNHLEVALKTFDKALKLKPDDAGAWYNKGVALSKLNRHEDALKAFDKALELKPDDAKAWYNKGIVFGKLNRHEDALKAYDKTLELKPDDAKAWYNTGIVFGKLNRYEDALKACDKALELNPDDADAWYNKGVALGELNRHEVKMH